MNWKCFICILFCVFYLFDQIILELAVEVETDEARGDYLALLSLQLLGRLLHVLLGLEHIAQLWATSFCATISSRDKTEFLSVYSKFEYIVVQVYPVRPCLTLDFSFLDLVCVSFQRPLLGVVSPLPEVTSLERKRKNG